jgi:uncharacterized protein with FMN-binding domain
MRKNTWVASTLVIGAISVVGGIGVDLWINLSSTPTPTGSHTPAPTSSGSVDMIVTGDAIQYRYGTVQVEVVRKGGKISAVNMIQSGATAGRQQAYPSLTKNAVAAQGSNFGNMSGATYTTAAFKQALDSAISKLT